jgi:hypothetical protein
LYNFKSSDSGLGVGVGFGGVNNTGVILILKNAKKCHLDILIVSYFILEFKLVCFPIDIKPYSGVFSDRPMVIGVIALDGSVIFKPKLTYS